MKTILLACLIFLSLGLFSHPHNSSYLEFDYSITQENDATDIYTVNAKIINKSNEAVYFLAESCNGLDYYITCNSTKAVSYRIIQCFTSFPQKLSIAALSGYSFKTRIKCTGNLKEVGLSLTFVQLSKSYSLEDKSENDVKQERRAHIKILKGPIVQLP